MDVAHWQRRADFAHGDYNSDYPGAAVDLTANGSGTATLTSFRGDMVVENYYLMAQVHGSNGSLLSTQELVGPESQPSPWHLLGMFA